MPRRAFLFRDRRARAAGVHQVFGHKDDQNGFHAVERISLGRLVADDVWDAFGQLLAFYRRSQIRRISHRRRWWRSLWRLARQKEGMDEQSMM